jgi:hypothetical protein
MNPTYDFSGQVALVTVAEFGRLDRGQDPRPSGSVLRPSAATP